MTEPVTTVDALVASVWQSYVAANELILNSARNADATEKKNLEGNAALQRQAQFIINNLPGKSSASIPVEQFYSRTLYYLRDLRLDVPCYAKQGMGFFGGREKYGTGMLHFFAPTRGQGLFHDCHFYRLIIKIDRGEVRVEFLPCSEEAAMQLGEGGAKSRSGRIPWKLQLTPEQEGRLRAVARIDARSANWRSAFRRAWEWIKAKVGKYGKGRKDE